MHAAFQISGFFGASAIFEFYNVSQLMWSKEVLKLLLFCLSFQLSYNTTQLPNNRSRILLFSSVDGGGPDLTEIILSQIGSTSLLIM
jgi:hypothetical protein